MNIGSCTSPPESPAAQMALRSPPVLLPPSREALSFPLSLHAVVATNDTKSTTPRARPQVFIDPPIAKRSRMLAIQL